MVRTTLLEFHVYFKGFMCKLHAECQVPADVRDQCQIVFLYVYNVSKVVPKYWTTKTLS